MMQRLQSLVIVEEVLINASQQQQQQRELGYRAYVVVRICFTHHNGMMSYHFDVFEAQNCKELEHFVLRALAALHSPSIAIMSD